MSNAVTIVGNLTKDPELRFSNGNGVATANFSVAVNKSKKDASGAWVNEPHYFDCVTFQEQAENFAASFVKGNRVMVIGKLQQRTWEDKETGAKRSKVEIVVDEVAASVRWATVAVTRTERAEGGNSYAEAGNRRPAPAQDINYSDEPF